MAKKTAEIEGFRANYFCEFCLFDYFYMACTRGIYIVFFCVLEMALLLGFYLNNEQFNLSVIMTNLYKLKTLALLACCMASVGAKAQSLYPVSMDEKVQQSAAIVEGRVVEQKSFWNPAHTMIFTANKVKVYKVFKGTAIPDYIELLTHGGSVGTESIEASDLLSLSKDEVGVFFCSSNSFNLRNPANNNLLWDVYSSAQGFLRYDLNSRMADAPFVRYSDFSTQLYQDVQTRVGHSYTVRDNSINQSLSTPTQPLAVGITSFSPTTVNAGATLDAANNQLTITGTGFGNPSGAAAVLFDDANNGTGGTAFTVAFNDPLIVSWSSTQIVVKVPSRVGTGTFQVRDDLGNLGGSPGVLTVRYSILTASFSSGTAVTKESNLMNDNGTGGYTILYSSSTGGSGVDLDASPAKATFQRALNSWKELVGFNVTEGGTTSSQTISPSDGQNVIMYDNFNTGVGVLSAGVLAVCYSFNSMCLPTTTNEVQKTEFDVVIRNTGVSSGSTAFTLGPCYPAVSEYDLETVLLHELGHALNLGHINDSYQGSFLPNINPGKLMHYAVLNGVSRRSPDWSALAGAKYAVQAQGNSYGSCGLASGEMTVLATTVESKDECPTTFPTTVTPLNTLVNFDLVHTTSNKNSDPQYTAMNCSGTGTDVVNTAFYPILTNGVGGTLSITVSGYATSPATLSSCSGAGIELALYETPSCPGGQSFPLPYDCRTFNANGPLFNITGLSPNTSYLLVADGVNGTKATFNLLLNGSAIPIGISAFNGVANSGVNELRWKTENAYSSDKILLEGAEDGVHFSTLYTQYINAGSNTVSGTYNDRTNAAIKYYRLKIINRDGSIQYSTVLTLRQRAAIAGISISPNPVKDDFAVNMYKSFTGKVQFTLFDINGKQLRNTTEMLAAGAQAVQLNLARGLASGTYLLRVTDGDKNTTLKVSVQ